MKVFVYVFRRRKRTESSRQRRAKRLAVEINLARKVKEHAHV